MDGGGKIIHQPPGSSSEGGKGGSPSGDTKYGSSTIKNKNGMNKNRKFYLFNS